VQAGQRDTRVTASAWQEGAEGLARADSSLPLALARHRKGKQP